MKSEVLQQETAKNPQTIATPNSGLFRAAEFTAEHVDKERTAAAHLEITKRRKVASSWFQPILCRTVLASPQSLQTHSQQHPDAAGLRHTW